MTRSPNPLLDAAIQRRRFLQAGAVSVAGLPLSEHHCFASEVKAKRSGFGKARNVIVMYCWGGMSHIDTFDMKPNAGSELRGEFQPVSTSVPGTFITEHLPLIGRYLHHLALVRSVHHQSADHRKAAYWNLTGHMPTEASGGVVAPTLPSRKDWPSIGAQVAIAMRNDKRYAKRKQVRRVNPAEANEQVDRFRVDWDQLKVIKRVSVSTDIVGPGHFPTGSFGKQDGYSNGNTVELIGMIGQAFAAEVPLTRQSTGPSGNFERFVAGDGTDGDWGSDTHGRSGNLWLIGNGEPDAPHKGFGCHANKFLTLDLDQVRQRHFNDTKRGFILSCLVGINGSPGVHVNAVGQAGIWIDGKKVALTRQLRRDDKAEKVEVAIRPGSKYLTLAMLNGNRSTYYDDIAMRDVELVEVEGKLPDPPPDEADITPPEEATEDLAANLPRTISIPYPLADRGILNGQFGGFLGLEYDPVFVHPGRGTSFKGISPNSGTIDLTPYGVSRRRLASRGLLLGNLNTGMPWAKRDDPESRLQASQDQAMNMLLSPEIQLAFDLSKEPKALHELYGNHVAGQSTLLARRLTDAGVPLVTVNLSVGDLNGASGDNWDTHGNNFNRLKNDLLPPWDRAASSLLQDLIQSGKIEDTLVVFLTEFGRTPRINGSAGRDHFPNCYSVLFAGAGVQGGLVHGKSDKMAAKPIEAACTPADIHATIFHSLGIPTDYQIYSADDRPLVMCDGTSLPLFG